MSVFQLFEDERGMISWFLSQIGLLLAAGVLLGAIAGLTFYNDWEKEAEAKNIASHMATAIESTALNEFPSKNTYLLPQKNYHYEVTVTTDYVTVTRRGGVMSDEIKGREALLIKPYVRLDGRDWKWSTSEELHAFLQEKYGHSGEDDDPFSVSNKGAIIGYLEEEQSDKAIWLAKNPLRITNINKPVNIEKTFIYFEDEKGRISRKGVTIVYTKGG